MIKCRGWSRNVLYDGTGLLWINPSPNIRSLTEGAVDPGVGLLEATNLATGRGTDTPFERVGDAVLDRARIVRGMPLIPTRFRVCGSFLSSSRRGERQYTGQRCGGVQILVTRWPEFDPLSARHDVGHPAPEDVPQRLAARGSTPPCFAIGLPMRR